MNTLEHIKRIVIALCIIVPLSLFWTWIEWPQFINGWICCVIYTAYLQYHRILELETKSDIPDEIKWPEP